MRSKRRRLSPTVPNQEYLNVRGRLHKAATYLSTCNSSLRELLNVRCRTYNNNNNNNININIWTVDGLDKKWYWFTRGRRRLIISKVLIIISAKSIIISRKAGSAATRAELKKLQKYLDNCVGVDFIPVAIESSGVWGQHAMELVSEIGRRLSIVSHEPRSTSFLRQRLAVAVQRGNESCISGTLQVNSSMNKL